MQSFCKSLSLGCLVALTACGVNPSHPTLAVKASESMARTAEAEVKTNDLPRHEPSSPKESILVEARVPEPESLPAPAPSPMAGSLPDPDGEPILAPVPAEKPSSAPAPSPAPAPSSASIPSSAPAPSSAPVPAPLPAPTPQLPTAKIGQPENDQLRATLEFQVVRNPNISPIVQFSPLLHVSGKTYFIWADLNNRPQITQKIGTEIKTRPLDDNADYAVAPDSHNGYSLGIDRDGYIHVMGDMHNYPSEVPRTPAMPSRYLDQNSMYWISKNPYDITAGFRYVGGKDSPQAIPAFSMSYPKFHHAPNGDLYLTLLTRAFLNIQQAFAPGAFGLGLYKYDAKAKTWAAIGEYPPDVQLGTDGSKYKVLFWEKAGVDNWFQGFVPGVHFDRTGTIHVAAVANIDTKLPGSTIAFYAKSADQGKTWQRADGSVIPGLPLRGIVSHPNHADIVVDTKGQSFLEDLTRVVTDYQGVPLVYCQNTWRRWDGQRWVQVVSQTTIGPEAFLGPDNILTFTGGYESLARAASASSPRLIHRYETFIPGILELISPSDIGMRTTGDLFVLDDEGKRESLRIYKVSFTSP